MAELHGLSSLTLLDWSLTDATRPLTRSFTLTRSLTLTTVQLKALREETERMATMTEPGIDSLGLDHEVIQVEEMDDPEVKKAIENVRDVYGT
jgi:hypothetical protein